MKIVLLAFLFIPFSIKSQELLPVKEGKVVFEQIDSVSGISKNELYSRSKIWLAKEFNSAKAVTELDDKDAGQIIGKGNFVYYYSVLGSKTPWTCSFTIQIDCRDNKARIKFYDISAKAAGEATAEHFNEYAKHSQQHIKGITNGMNDTIASFKKALSIQSSDNF